MNTEILKLKVRNHGYFPHQTNPPGMAHLKSHNYPFRDRQFCQGVFFFFFKQSLDRARGAAGGKAYKHIHTQPGKSCCLQIEWGQWDERDLWETTEV